MSRQGAEGAEGLRRASREKVFQTLFMMDFLGVGPDDATPLFALVSSPVPDVEYYDGTVRGVWENREEIDELIRRAAEHWRLERMRLVDRNIPRLGGLGTCLCRDIPLAVGIH